MGHWTGALGSPHGSAGQELLSPPSIDASDQEVYLAAGLEVTPAGGRAGGSATAG